MFLQVCVILFTGGVCLSACWDTTPPQEEAPQEADTPKMETPPKSRHHPPRRRTPPRRRQTPPPPKKQTPPQEADTPQEAGSSIRSMERPVRILLECILVTACKRSLRQGNVFTPVCHSFLQGCMPHCMLGYTPGHPPDTPLTHTPPGHHPGRQPLDTHPPNTHTHTHTQPPGHPYRDTMGYDQQVDGMHPTGMHTCYCLQ